MWQGARQKPKFWLIPIFSRAAADITTGWQFLFARPVPAVNILQEIQKKNMRFSSCSLMFCKKLSLAILATFPKMPIFQSTIKYSPLALPCSCLQVQPLSAQIFNAKYPIWTPEIVFWRLSPAKNIKNSTVNSIYNCAVIWMGQLCPRSHDLSV